jgi:hypothetical protein
MAADRNRSRDEVLTSLRLNREVDDLWGRVAKHMGIKKAQVFRVALHDLARRQGVAIESEVRADGQP